MTAMQSWQWRTVGAQTYWKESCNITIASVIFSASSGKNGGGIVGRKRENAKLSEKAKEVFEYAWICGGGFGMQVAAPKLTMFCAVSVNVHNRRNALNFGRLFGHCTGSLARYQNCYWFIKLKFGAYWTCYTKACSSSPKLERNLIKPKARTFPAASILQRVALFKVELSWSA